MSARQAIRRHARWFVAGLASGGALVGLAVGFAVVTRPVQWDRVAR